MNRVLRLPSLVLALIIEVYRFVVSQLKLLLLKRRSRIVHIFAERIKIEENQPKVLVVITHIASIEAVKCAEKGRVKTEKLSKPIEGVVSSFAHCELEIIINTIRERHITAYLPEYQRSLIRIKEQEDCDAMFVGFKAQDELIAKIDDFDWFLYLEDDIVIQDSCFLDKIECFNKNSGDKRAVIMPNRYEMCKGIKTYIDYSYSEKQRSVYLLSNSLSKIEIGGMKFCKFENQHSGLYCLSRQQLKLWKESGRFWQDQVVMVGPLESAATGCLFESFSLYKPSAENLHFLEVQHWDTKYSEHLHGKGFKIMYQPT